eukprot:GHRQ01020134.1.p1 GENE.GHRQ01020134.1~~GHRQ01020134.1.p1  ORF type:complete len:191 (+),score=85.08 GHRQ01020134.1:70-573(+)
MHASAPVLGANPDVTPTPAARPDVVIHCFPDLPSLCLCCCFLQEASEDVRTLARLCQLQVKMQAVDTAGTGSTYEARISRVVAVASSIEERLAKRLELLDGYARVMNMIEIEVEMDMQVPIAELETLGVEMEKLSELESIKEEWQLQAEAQDEVERLLKSSPALPCQ